MNFVVKPPPASKPKPMGPLLPAVLRGPAAFFWLWVLPIGVLLLLNIQAFWLVEGNLDAHQRHDALLLGAANIVNFLVGAAIYLTGRYATPANRPFAEQPAWSISAIVVQVIYLWWMAGWTDRVLPASVTTWIYPETRHLFNQFAFGM